MITGFSRCHQWAAGGFAAILAFYVSPASADASRFLEVPAWQGIFWLRHDADDPRGPRGAIANRVSGTFLLDERDGRDLWLGTSTSAGALTWRVDEWREACIGRSACTVTIVQGSGGTGLDEESDLEIDVWSGRYELYIVPDGWRTDGLQVAYEVTLPGRILFDDGGALGIPRPRLGSAINEGPAGIHAMPESLVFMFDDPMPLPSEGLVLCNRVTRSDGAEMAWKVWPAGEAQPQCPAFEPLPDDGLP